MDKLDFLEEVKLPLVKILFDKALAAFFLVLTFPLNVLVALAIKLDGFLEPRNQGSIFYREERVSQDKTFQLVKFRILKTEAIKS